MKILFFGTSDFAVQSLKALLNTQFRPTAVVTQPDKPKGRGYALTPTPVKETAVENSIDVYTPQSLKDFAIHPLLEQIRPDMIIVVAYGKILPKYILDFPPLGCINVHASLLPKYRGAAPINHAIINGETETGITTMYMDEGLDTGDMILKQKTEINSEENFGELHDRLAQMGGELLIKTLELVKNGTAPREKQTDDSSYAFMIDNNLKRLDFSDSTKNIINLIRGLSPAPCAFCYNGNKKIKIYKASYADCPKDKYDYKAGDIVDVSTITVRTGDGAVRIEELQPEGKKRMPASEFLKGNKLFRLD